MFNFFKKNEMTIEVTMRREGYQVPQVELAFRENGEFVYRTSK